jgi:anti-sigma-K factor RskA
VEEDLMHELTPGYALNALSLDEARAYELHLAGCAACQTELARLVDTAAALGFAAPPLAPPAELRGRILDAARADRPGVVPLRPRWAYPVAAVAAVAACAAIALGIYAASLKSQLDSRAQALHTLTLNGAAGSVVVGHRGDAALVVSGLRPAPAGKTYEVWVIRGGTANPAGLFRGTPATVHLTRRVPAGSVVGVTLEPAGGSARPTSAPVVTSSPA